MFGSRQRKITIDPDLYERLEKTARAAGYATAEEFIRHVLETAAPAAAAAESAEAIRKQLQGLGYFD